MSGAITWPGPPLSKGQAFTLHLVISLLVFSSLVFMMVLYWFPGELFFLDGGWQGLKLVAMVDLILGPILTLLLYKPGKPKLLLDMSMIAAFQIAALGYGFYTTYHQRTVGLIYADKAFTTLSSQAKADADAKLRSLDLQPQTLAKARLLKLPLALAPDPTAEEYGQFLEDLFNGYPEPHERSDRYVAIDSQREQMLKQQLDDDGLKSLGLQAKVNQIIKDKKLDPTAIELYRFKARYAEGVVLFNSAENRIIDYIKRPETPQQVANAEPDS